MKNLNVKIGVAALLIGSAAAFSTSARTLDTKWGFNQSTGMYQNLTGKTEGVNFRCDASADLCTETYPSSVNPNDQAHDQYPGTAAPTSSQDGDLVIIP